VSGETEAERRVAAGVKPCGKGENTANTKKGTHTEEQQSRSKSWNKAWRGANREVVPRYVEQEETHMLKAGGRNMLPKRR